MKAEIEKALAASSNSEIAKGLLQEFLSLQRNFALKQWRYSGLDAGHFVEWARRYLDLVQTGSITPLTSQLPKLNEVELKRLEGLSGDEGLRILVPRALFLINTMRNKRGIGHLSQVAANATDAALVLASCKWILSEFLRVGSNLSNEDTSWLVEKLSERHIDGFWSDEGVERILHVGLTLKEQMLFYLFNRSPTTIAALSAATGSASTYVRKVARDLDKRKLVVYEQSKNSVVILPTGERAAEDIIERRQLQ